MADLLDWATRAGAGATVELVCQDADALITPGTPGSTLARLPGCVGAAPLALPYELLARGVTHVTLRVDACPQPRPAQVQRWAGLFATHAPDRVSLRLEAPGAAAPVEPVPAGRMTQLTRRGLIGRFTAPSTDQPPPTGTAHQRLRRAVNDVVGPAPNPDEETGGREGVGMLLEASNCDLAGVCVQACPEDALAIERTAARARLVLDMGACSGCGTCIEACPTQALRQVGSASWRSLTDAECATVADVATRTCERCRATFGGAGTETLCPTCAFRRANPFTGVPPAEVRMRLMADARPVGVSQRAQMRSGPPS